MEVFFIDIHRIPSVMYYIYMAIRVCIVHLHCALYIQMAHLTLATLGEGPANSLSHRWRSDSPPTMGCKASLKVPSNKSNKCFDPHQVDANEFPLGIPYCEGVSFQTGKVTGCSSAHGHQRVHPAEVDLVGSMRLTAWFEEVYSKAWLISTINNLGFIISWLGTSVILGTDHYWNCKSKLVVEFLQATETALPLIP